MDELRTTLERQIAEAGPAPFELETIMDRHARQRRRKRVAANAVGVAILIGLLIALSSVLVDRHPSPIPIAPPTRLPANGAIIYRAGLGQATGGLFVARNGDVTEILSDHRSRRCPTYSPDGGRLAFAQDTPPDSERLPAPVSISVLDVDRAGVPIGRPTLVARTRMLEPDLLCPVWAPGGRSLAYIDDKGVWVVPSDGGAPRQLLEDRGGAIRYLAWSPDGSSIAVSVDDEVLLVQMGSAADRVLYRGAQGMRPSWSPSGDRLAIGRDLDSWGRLPGVLVIDVADGGVTALTGPGVGGQPAWSPDGERIAFSQEDRMHLVDVVSGEVTELPAVQVPAISKRALSIWGAPHWSPDGRRLLTIASVLRPELAYAVVSVGVDDASVVAETPASIDLYFTTPKDIDWQGLPR